MAENKKITTYPDYLANLTDAQRSVIEEMKRLVLETIPGVEERMAWSAPWYYLDGKPVVWFATASKHVNFGFAFGAHLKSDLLEGTGKNMRHVKIKNMDDLQEKEKELVKLLKEAATVEI